ncbi:MAG: quinoprotein dehydrogenase-associated putative ABC transporter substrate-binding protein [Hyphomicrobiaceae bacterium]|nr:quinoprotein dehydrogenase-associated putative ABC transporter substrate-binding protein [Hyphomicrobiaceae bacterium]
MRTLLMTVLAAFACVQAVPAAANDQLGFRKEVDFDKLTPAEHTAARRASRDYRPPTFVVCADPGNMPLSSADRQGYQNKIAELLATTIGATIEFFWRPYIERGLTRETFANRECDILMGMPEGYEGILTTIPIYRSTYVFATRADRNITIADLDDPQLRTLRLGLFQHSGLRETLSRRGVRGDNVDVHIISQMADLDPTKQPWRQVQRVVDGELDIAAVWGPFAGYVKHKLGAPLSLQPANAMDQQIPLEFSLSIGMRTTHVLMKYKLDAALIEVKDQIAAILKEYGVPLVQCSKCVVAGDIPSHGSYYESFMAVSHDRYLKTDAGRQRRIDESKATADQIVSRQRLDAWLAEGADVDQELHNAVVATDPDRIGYLIDKGARIDKPNAQGYATLHTAARNRDADIVELLLARGADKDVTDADGWTALMHAAFRNHVPSIQVLAKAGAALETENAVGLTALGVAITERSFWAAKALIEAGAALDRPMGPSGLTPLMLLATQQPAAKREKQIEQGPDALDIARALVAGGALVNMATADGVTPLMVAAGHDNPAFIGFLVERGADLAAANKAGKTAVVIAREAGHDRARQSLEFLARLAVPPGGRDGPAKAKTDEKSGKTPL